MFRSANPKNQAALIETFVKASGGTVSHTKLLELVARLNGVANWNVMQGERVLSASRKEISAKVREFMEPLAKSWHAPDALLHLLPVKAREANESVLDSLYHCLASTSCNTGPENFLRQLHERITLLKLAVGSVEQDISAALGLRKMRDRAPEEVMKEFTLITDLYTDDSEREWDLQSGETSLFVTEALLTKLVAQGLVTGAVLTYSDGRRYGAPDAATDIGGMQWLWAHGFTVESQFLMQCEDTRDDTSPVMSVTILVPMSLAAIVDSCIAEEEKMQEAGTLILSAFISYDEEWDWTKFDGINHLFVSQQALELIQAHGTVIKAVSHYPNGAKYGIPDTAIRGVFENLLKEEGFLNLVGWQFTACDTKDESGAYAVMHVRLPRDTLKIINDLLV
jgi:hypothetical protein